MAAAFHSCADHIRARRVLCGVRFLRVLTPAWDRQTRDGEQGPTHIQPLTLATEGICYPPPGRRITGRNQQLPVYLRSFAQRLGWHRAW